MHLRKLVRALSSYVWCLDLNDKKSIKRHKEFVQAGMVDESQSSEM